MSSVSKSWTKGLFLRRYKRFFAEIQVDDSKIITAHLPNTGSLKGCLEEGAACYFSQSPNKNRKLPYTLESVKAPQGWVGVNTHRAEKIFESYLVKEKPKSCYFSQIKTQEGTRIDFLICKKPMKNKPTKQNLEKKPKDFHLIEVKSVTLANKKLALFPDTVTLRGQKHLKELMRLQKIGLSCELVFVIQRSNCSDFCPADDIDPEYGRLLRQARRAGVHITALVCKVDPAKGQIEVTEKASLNF